MSRTVISAFAIGLFVSGCMPAGPPADGSPRPYVINVYPNEVTIGVPEGASAGEADRLARFYCPGTLAPNAVLARDDGSTRRYHCMNQGSF